MPFLLIFLSLQKKVWFLFLYLTILVPTPILNETRRHIAIIFKYFKYPLRKFDDESFQH